MCQIYHILDEFFIGLLLLPVALMETFHFYVVLLREYLFWLGVLSQWIAFFCVGTMFNASELSGHFPNFFWGGI